MRRALPLSAFLLAACGSSDIDPGHYQYNDLRLATSYRAKEVCSCLFVVGQTEAFCTAWTVASPNVATFQVNYGSKAVEAEALMAWGARARYVDEQTGCVAE